MSKTDLLVRRTRFYRWLHKFVAVPVLVFMLFIGITGLLLGWKKQLQLLPKTLKSKEQAEQSWISIDSMMILSRNYLNSEKLDTYIIDRIDIRPSKGIAKVIFSNAFTELQLDGKTGEILSVKQRNSDLIEKIHDGSIVDFLINTDNQYFKLLYTSWVSLSLILLSVSGFFLWFNPKRIRKAKHVN